jgi:hypothetical protein
LDVIDHAVRNLGFVHLTAVRNALLVKFEPTTISRLAAIAAFYEIAGRVPKRLILACPGKAGAPDRCEIFHDLAEGLGRFGAAIEAHQNADGAGRSEPREARAGRGSGQSSGREPAEGGRVVSLRRPDEPAIGQQAEDFSKRSRLPVKAIAPQDEWLGRLASMWRKARPGGGLPALEALDPLEVVNIARGRAHIVDTTAPDPGEYRFRVWGAGSLGKNYRNHTLAQMPAGLMREDALGGYWEAVRTGAPSYQLIQHVENGRRFSYARLLLPLAADGQHVDQLLVLFNERPLPELAAL